MDLLYLSHCLPGAPDKGDKIRAYHQLHFLAASHRVHLVCFARSRAEAGGTRDLLRRCASVYVEPLRPAAALVRAALRFAAGGCLTESFYASGRMRRYVRELARQTRLSAVLAYSTPMAQYAPPGLPLLLDMCDVDSEKFRQYASMRPAGPLYTVEAARLRRLEVETAGRARCTVLVTNPERELLESLAGGARVRCAPNGIDGEYFDPQRAGRLPELEGRRFLVFIGALDYYPNVEGVRWFAARVLPRLRRRDPSLEFWIVGRNPARAVRALSNPEEGITVAANPVDVRPYLAASAAVAAPLHLARGIQNKVLEALAMGKRVFASTAICRTFGRDLPAGIVPCNSEGEFADAVAREPLTAWACDAAIRREACEQFSWPRTLALLEAELLGIRAKLPDSAASML